MKALKLIAITIGILVGAVLILFFQYTSFVDKLNITIPEKTDFIHPSRILIKYEIFISGTVMRPAYKNFVKKMNLNGNEKILDFGSGSGGEAIHIAPIINNKNGKLTCIDISPSWMEVVKYRLADYRNVEYVAGDINGLKIPENSFDVIAVRLVMHDVPERLRKSIIDRFFKIIRPGGSIYIFEPIGKDHAMDETEMRSLFKTAGFKERYFKKNFSFTMIPPGIMGEAAYDK